MASIPYVTTAVFKAHPTFLDLNNLRSGDSVLADQEAELATILLMASNWADEQTGREDGSLQAAAYVERVRLRPDRQGRLTYRPDYYPVQQISGLSWGTDPANLTALTDLTGLFIEKKKWVTAPLGHFATGMSSLQFGAPTSDRELYTQWAYVGGYPHTTLAAASASGATSLTVANPVGITAGQVLRIWDPGAEEPMTVAASYVAGSTEVTLAAPLVNAHTTGAMVSALPPAAVLAVINYATAALMRPDTAAEDAYPDTRVRSSTRKADSRKDGSGLVAEAQRLLVPYMRRR